MLLPFSISILFDGSLEIRNATKNDEGVYTCFAENGRGKANSSGYLTITGPRAREPPEIEIFAISVISVMLKSFFVRGYRHYRSPRRL